MISARIYYASKFECISTLKLLLQDNSGHYQAEKTLTDTLNGLSGRYKTALQAASAGGHTIIAWLLLGNGADVNLTSRIDKATPLMAASDNGQTEVAWLLLDQGAYVNVNEGGYWDTPLLAASYGGHTEIVQLLLDFCADIEAENCDDGTALTTASSEGYAEIVQLLLDKGAGMESEGDCATPLDAASCKGLGMQTESDAV
ncbi:hypothetical protein CHU98_g6447 [Xylaria longipes]|nr:hypothetical protein CHU98_g6447 [Xylaria longipes]